MIDKQTQDQAWAALTPDQRKKCRECYKRYAPQRAGAILTQIFGAHNLTSDAEPEEMLLLPRKQVQNMYAANEQLKIDFPGGDIAHTSDQINHVLCDFFGSKCLPDIVDSSDDSKAEPKFKLWDWVLYDGAVHRIVGILPCAQYHLSGHEYAVLGTDLEPYPAPAHVYKLGDKVLRAGKVHTVVRVDLDPSVPYQIEDQQGNTTWSTAENLTPYTEPTQTNDNMEEKEHRNLSQDSANCDKGCFNLNATKELYDTLCTFESASITVRKALIKYSNDNQQ